MWSATRRLIPRRLRSQNITTIATNQGISTPPPHLHEKPIGDISSIFPSLSGSTPPPLPQRFADLKQQIIAGNETALQASWDRLLPQLAEEINTIRQHGSSIIPSIDFSSLSTLSPSTLSTIRHRGCVIIRNVLPHSLALSLKSSAQSYIRANHPNIRAFPASSPSVYELYWSPSQVAARSHKNVLNTQRFLQQLWHSSSPTTPLSTSHPLTYADRLHPEYRRVYSNIFDGNWELYDPFDAKYRVDAKMDLYHGAGACSMFRMFQGWLSLSSTGPGEGTLRLLPALKTPTAYFLLRPFFSPQGTLQLPPTPHLQGANMAACQEFSPTDHPALRLQESMISIPKVQPGDFVAWHCDMLHMVDREHSGTRDSSVLYIPATPLTKGNVKVLKQQRDAAWRGVPPPDFPGGEGEGGFRGRMDWRKEGTREMGMGTRGWEVEGGAEGEREAVREGNRELGWE
ncbi:hypothetical protein BDD12DRAFT_832808 [Trichophaea hybrida]|nr:hypothetical protein BDD12DRAFT_832808 [Trichophaea hybrida]